MSLIVSGYSIARMRLAEAKLVDRGLPWKRARLSRVQRIIEFLEFLPITKGPLAGTNLRLLPEQWEFIHGVYARPDNSPVRLGVLSYPRGNGKTGLCAGLALCHLLGPEAETRGEVYAAAMDRQQAGLICGEMEAIIEQVPEFGCRVTTRRWPFRTIIVEHGDGAGSKFEALSADGRRGHGLSPTFWIYDELAQAKDRRLLDSLQTAMGKRKRSLGLIISTQAGSDDHPLSELIDDATAHADPSIVVHILSAPVAADPFAAETIRAVNPAFGYFLNEPDVLAEAERARRMPSFESAFRNLRLNQRIAVTSRDQLVTKECWDAGNDPIDLKLFSDGREVYGGVDLSESVDLTAMVLATVDDDGIVHLLPRAWTPADTLAQRMTYDRAPYDAWVREGRLIAVPGKAIDFDYVADELGDACARMNIVRINFDAWRSKFFDQACQRVGVAPPIEPFGQGFKSMSPAVEAFERLALEGKIRHGGDPLLRWCMSNMVISRDAAGNRKPDKANGYGRIDVAVAAIMAVAAIECTNEPAFNARTLIG
jgi:phage terminase large subunit-like protein